MKPMLIAPLCLTALLAACADMGADVDPILDGAPRAQFQSDLAASRSLARSQSQLDHDTMAAAAIGAGMGGVLGEIDDEGDALGGAVVVGALAGAAAGASAASDTREDIVLNCLRGRGHAVVN